MFSFSPLLSFRLFFSRNLNPIAGTSWYILLLFVTCVFHGIRVGVVTFLLTLLIICYIAFGQKHLLMTDVALGLLPYGSVAFFFYVFHSYNKKLKQEIEQQKARFAHLAHYDALTDIPGRNALLSYLEKQLALHGGGDDMLAVLFLDLDNFKQINDMHGHAAGDKVLRVVAKRLQHTIRASDMLARLGGDEFIIVMDHIKDPEDIRSIIAHVFQAIHEPVVYRALTFDLTLSIGVAIAPQDDTNTIDLLGHADQAMYQAKHNGGDDYCFYPNLEIE